MVAGIPFVDRRRRTRIDVVDPVRLRLVHEGQFLAIGRPVWMVAVAGAQPGESALFAQAIGRLYRELVLPAPVAPVGDPLPVGRPRGRALSHSRAPGEVQDRTMLCRDGEDLTPGLDHRALARGRDPPRLYVIGHVLDPGLEAGEIAHHLNVHLAVTLAVQIDEVELPTRLEDDLLRTDRREMDIEVGELRDLASLAAAPVVRPDVVPHRRARIAQVVERLPGPHRLRVIRRIVRQVVGFVGFEVKGPDVGVPSTPVALPGAEVAGSRHVGERPPVGRDHPELAVRHGELLRHPTLGGRLVELAVALPTALHRARVEHRPAVGIPVQHPVAVWVVRKPNRIATEGRHHVDIGVPVVVAAERDPTSVGGEAWEGLLALRRAQLLGRPARLRDDPDVSRVDEGDVRGGYVRVAEHPGVHLRLERLR